MEQIRNANEKLVCCVDGVKKVVQILSKGHITIIRFLDNGQVEVINKQVAYN